MQLQATIGSWGYDIDIPLSWSWGKTVGAGEQLDWVYPKGTAAMLSTEKMGIDGSKSL